MEPIFSWLLEKFSNLSLADSVNLISRIHLIFASISCKHHFFFIAIPLYFIFLNLILLFYCFFFFFTLQYCIGFAIHQYASTTGVHITFYLREFILYFLSHISFVQSIAILYIKINLISRKKRLVAPLTFLRFSLCQ